MSEVMMRTDRILVKQLKSEDVTEGGIIIPDNSKVKQAWGVVHDQGPDVEDIQEGDTVAFADFSGVSVELLNDEGKKEEWLVMSQDDVFLVLRDEEQGINTQELNTDAPKFWRCAECDLTTRLRADQNCPKCGLVKEDAKVARYTLGT